MSNSSHNQLSTKEEKSQQLAVITTQNRQNKPVKVLDEDTFIDKLESIIERDFFPDLEKLKLQQAYYEAQRANDTEAIRELYLKYSNLVTRTNRSTAASSTPAYFDTPLITKKKAKKNEETEEAPYCNEEPPDDAEDSKLNKNKVSLDKFLAENTSEDNVSFEAIMTDSEKKNKLKLHQGWLHDKEKLHKQKQENALMLENGNRGPDDSVTRSLDSWTYTAKNTLMYIPEGAPLTDQEMLEKSKHTRVINHSNTRFNSEMIKSMYQTASSASSSTPSSTKPNPNLNIITKVGVDGKEQDIKDTPQVKGYKFVDATPSPMPGRSLGDESPMMTWGEIESTPFRLEGSATPYFGKIPGAPEFKIPDVPEREKIALNLEEKASAARRKKKKEAIEHMQRLTSPSHRLTSPYANSISDKITLMSPAAQKLLSTKLNLKLTDTTKNLASPSPLRISSSKSSITSPFFGALSSPSTKNSSISATSSSSSIDNLRLNLKRPSNSLTDNLLKLPKPN